MKCLYFKPQYTQPPPDYQRDLIPLAALDNQQAHFYADN